MLTKKETISIESSAFYELLRLTLDHIDKEYGLNKERLWVGTDDAMALLGIKSKTTLLQLRAEGKIKYSQPQHKIILYNRQSILEYIERHAKETF